MKANLSPLSIIDIGITSMEFKTVFPDNPNDDPQTYYQQYDIDIDFGIRMGKTMVVYVSAKINYGEEMLPGYSMHAEAGCFFKFDNKSELTKAQIADMEGFSTIYIALNSLRGLISSFTANAPFGRYILPSVDLNELIAKKRATITNNKKKQTSETTIEKKPRKSTRKKS